MTDGATPKYRDIHNPVYGMRKSCRYVDNVDNVPPLFTLPPSLPSSPPPLLPSFPPSLLPSSPPPLLPSLPPFPPPFQLWLQTTPPVTSMKVWTASPTLKMLHHKPAALSLPFQKVHTPILAPGSTRCSANSLSQCTFFRDIHAHVDNNYLDSINRMVHRVSSTLNYSLKSHVCFFFGCYVLVIIIHCY